MKKKYSACDRIPETETETDRERERERDRERERERGRGRERERGMEVRDKTAADRAFLCTRLTAPRDREHKMIISSEPECGLRMNGSRR